MSGQYPKRGDIWWVALDPTIGSEIKKTRPCVVLSINEVNQYRRTVLVIPLSSSVKENPPVTIAVTCQGKPCIAIVDQLRAVSKERLQGFIEKMNPKEFENIIKSLLTVIEA